MPVTGFQDLVMRGESFLLVLMRVSCILFMMPLWGSRNLPGPGKAGLALIVSLVLLPLVKIQPGRFPADAFSFAFFLLGELMIGFVLGLSVKVILAAVQMGGEFAGFQMGFTMANVIDPQSGMDTTVLSQFSYLLGLLIFLSMDGHHWFFRALAQSFQLLPPGEVVLRWGLVQHFLQLSGQMFIVAMKMVAPVTAVLLCTQIALGILSKAVPQINLLITSFPLTIVLGLLVLGVALEVFWPRLSGMLQEEGAGLISTLLPLMRR